MGMKGNLSSSNVFGIGAVKIFSEDLISHLNANPSSPVANRFRRFCEHQLLPAVAEMADLLRDHGTVSPTVRAGLLRVCIER